MSSLTVNEQAATDAPAEGQVKAKATVENFYVHTCLPGRAKAWFDRKSTRLSPRQS